MLKYSGFRGSKRNYRTKAKKAHIKRPWENDAIKLFLDFMIRNKILNKQKCFFGVTLPCYR